MKANPQTKLHVVDVITPVRKSDITIYLYWYWTVVGLWSGWVLLAEFIKQFLKDENGSSWTEYDERLATKQTENSPCQSSAKEALHHPLGKGTEKQN